MSTLSSVPEEKEMLIHQIERYSDTDSDVIAGDIQTLINQQIKSVLTEVEKELRLDEGSGELHISHLCPRDSVDCAKFAQRSQTRHWQREAIQKIRSRYE